MYKNERQVVALFLGGIILLIGVLLIFNSLSSKWVIEEIHVNVLKLIGGGFITLIGTVIFLSGISEDAIESVSDFLGDLWDRFLEALSR